MEPGGKVFDYFVVAPTGPAPSEGFPLLVAWAGAAGPGLAVDAARRLRDDWLSVARAAGLIVVAQVATGASGGWIPQTAETRLLAILESVRNEWPTDDSRRYAFGFSAGGHVLHDIALRDVAEFAAYAVRAGSLEAYAGVDAASGAARIVPLWLSVGTSDSLLPLVREDRDRFQKAGWQSQLEYRETPDGHRYGVVDLQSAWSFVCRQAR